MDNSYTIGMLNNLWGLGQSKQVKLRNIHICFLKDISPKEVGDQ
jgi:hypothetical protein